MVKNMKKIYTIVLVLVMMLTFTSCGGKGISDSKCLEDFTYFDTQYTHINFESFDLYHKKVEDGSQVLTLYSPEYQIEINENTYNHIAQYLRTMFNIFPKVEKAKGKTTKQWLIEEERDKLKVQKDDDTKSFLYPLVSTYVNHPGTKYKSNELCEIGIYEFMDSVQRMQIYESTIALMHGMYSGMIDTKEIHEESLNFMRDK